MDKWTILDEEQMFEGKWLRYNGKCQGVWYILESKWTRLVNKAKIHPYTSAAKLINDTDD